MLNHLVAPFLHLRYVRHPLTQMGLTVRHPLTQMGLTVGHPLTQVVLTVSRQI